MLLPTFTTALQAAGAHAEQYQQQVRLLKCYVAHLGAYKWPELEDGAAWPGGARGYGQAQAGWVNLSGAWQGWAASTLETVTTLPALLANGQAEIVGPLLGAAIEATELLVQDPGNEAARELLSNTAQILSSRFSEYGRMVCALVDSLTAQAEACDQGVQTMREVADQALRAAGANQRGAMGLNEQMQQLTEAVWGNALSVTKGELAISLNAAALRRELEALGQANRQLKRYLADLAGVTQLASDVSAMANQGHMLKAALSVVISPWQYARDQFIQAAEILRVVESAACQWDQVKVDVIHVRSEWIELVTILKRLSLPPENE